VGVETAVGLGVEAGSAVAVGAGVILEVGVATAAGAVVAVLGPPQASAAENSSKATMIDWEKTNLVGGDHRRHFSIGP
jgi:hypothetical protein